MSMRSKPGHVALCIPRHGQFETDVTSFDGLIAEYGSWSLESLRAKIQKVSVEEFGSDIDYSDLRTVTECLFILVELTGLATN